METKSPKRPREVNPSRTTAEKRLKAESGDARCVSESENAVVTTPVSSNLQLTNLPADTLQTVRKSFSRYAETKARVVELQGYCDCREAQKTVLGAIPEVPASLCSGNEQAMIADRYAEERRKQESLQEAAGKYEEQLRYLEENLRLTQTDTQTKVREKKLILEEMEARKSAALEQRKRDNDKLRSMLENYRRLTGLEITAMESGGQRCRLRMQQKEVIFRVEDVNENEMEVQVLSYTVPADRIPEDLKEEVVIEKKDGPKLLHLLLSCLL